MKILLQDRKTGLYFQKPAGWTEEMEEAFDFGNSDEAIEYSHARHLTGVQVIAAFFEKEYVESVTIQIASAAHANLNLVH